MRISDWSSDVCSSDLPAAPRPGPAAHAAGPENKGFWRLPPKSGPCYTSAASQEGFASGSPCGPPRQVPQAEQVIRVHDPIAAGRRAALRAVAVQGLVVALLARSEEHTSELQSLMRL